MSPHVYTCRGIRIPECGKFCLWTMESTKFCLWNPESCTSEYKETAWTVISYNWNDKETNPVVDPESKDCNPQYKIVLGYNMGKTTNWLDKLQFIADMHHVFVL